MAVLPVGGGAVVVIGEHLEDRRMRGGGQDGREDRRGLTGKTYYNTTISKCARLRNTCKRLKMQDRTEQDRMEEVSRYMVVVHIQACQQGRPGCR